MLQFSDLQAWHHTATLHILKYNAILVWSYIFWVDIIFNAFNNLKNNTNMKYVTHSFTFLVFITTYRTIFTDLASKCLSAFWHPA
jgi:hypothetical protein